MKHKIVFLCFLFLLSCGEETPVARDPMALFPASEAPLCTLFVADTVGVEMGDSNYVFGNISGTAIGPGSELFVSDNIRCCVSRFYTEGEFVGRIGNRGEGPGEFLHPGGVAVSHNGLLCVSDAERGWFCFSPEGEELVFNASPGRTPMQMQAAPGGGIIGIKSDLTRDNDRFAITKTLALWDEADPDSVIADYLTLDYNIATMPIDEFRRDLIAVDFFPVLTAAGTDFVCAAPSPRDEPLILVYERNGEFRDSLVLPYPEVRRTDAEMAEQKAFVEELFYTTSRHTHTVDWDPYPCFPLITSLGVDSLDRIWVQRGFEHYTVFDLFTPDCSYSGTAVLPEVTADMHWEFRVYPRGIVAVPQVPESYYTVHRIGGVQDEQI